MPRKVILRLRKGRQLLRNLKISLMQLSNIKAPFRPKLRTANRVPNNILHGKNVIFQAPELKPQEKKSLIPKEVLDIVMKKYKDFVPVDLDKYKSWGLPAANMCVYGYSK